MLELQKIEVKDPIFLQEEAFTEQQMLEKWYHYADKLSNKGHQIMASMLSVGTPKLKENIIFYELPNEGSKLDFEKEQNELTSYLRNTLNNYLIEIEVVVNETIKSKTAFTVQEKFERLNEINPDLLVLKRIFDLDF